MGYTHYWIIKDTTKNLCVPNIAQDVRAILMAGETPIADGWGTPGTEPLVNEDMVDFNGVGDECHEGFSFPPEKGSSTTDVFDFCKTARKPYDTVVCAAIMAVKHHLKGNVRVSSDGDFDEPLWQNAYLLYHRALRREVPQQFRKYENKEYRNTEDPVPHNPTGLPV